MTAEEPASAEAARRDDAPKPADEPAPRIRLKPNLATDPALQPQATTPALIKPDPDSGGAPSSPSEYLSALPAVLQNAMARGFYLPLALDRAADQPPVYVCPPCGIRFSSLSTLEAHQTYYCSHRQKTPSTTTGVEADDAKSLSSTEPSGSQSDQDQGVNSSESAQKAARTGKQYACAHCTYSADKKVSLNRHMRMHAVSPSPAASPSVNGDPPAGEVATQDRYCAECDIRFSSQKTYRAHKTHYCSSRHNKATSKPASSCTSESTPTSPTDPQTASPTSPTSASTAPQQPFLALPTNPIIIVPYSLFRGASILSGILPSVPSANSPCFLLPNGTIQPMSQALSAPTLSQTQNDVLKISNKSKDAACTGIISKDCASAPLDLSIRKGLADEDHDHDQEKENLKRNKSPSLRVSLTRSLSLSPEKIECAPSIRGSPPLTPSSRASTASPKRKHEDSRSNSPRQVRPKSINASANNEPDQETFSFPTLHPAFLRAGSLFPEVQLRLASEMPSVAPAPQVLVKQGVSKCKECNIVFCKHENYLVHKRHYCSARLQDDESSPGNASPPKSPGATPAGQYQQLICLACGIKFTSLDNLNAHQSYYCLKRGELDGVRRCTKCRGVAETGHQCPSVAVGAAVSMWKCPCCDVVSPTASAAQRHMETHAGVKAFRCKICRYKGNTLRGMRTHIRMHFDKRSPDLQVRAVHTS